MLPPSGTVAGGVCDGEGMSWTTGGLATTGICNGRIREEGPQRGDSERWPMTLHRVHRRGPVREEPPARS